MRNVEAIPPTAPARWQIVRPSRVWPAHTRSRQVGCTALKAFADCFEITLPQDIETLWGSYGNSKTQRRVLPTVCRDPRLV